MSECPCNSQLDYNKCCGLYIDKDMKAPTAEALMRSRYTAFTKADIDYIARTHHPSTRKQLDLPSTEKWARNAEWIKLEVLNTEKGDAKAKTGVVEFKAHYQIAGKPQVLHEISQFERKDDEWFYVDGDLPEVKQYIREHPKVGRNDPCICGSGKKYKKCCGKN